MVGGILTVLIDFVNVDAASVPLSNCRTVSFMTLAQNDLWEIYCWLSAAGWSDPLYSISLFGASHTVYLCTHHSMIS